MNKNRDKLHDSILFSSPLVFLHRLNWCRCNKMCFYTGLCFPGAVNCVPSLGVIVAKVPDILSGMCTRMLGVHVIASLAFVMN
jgi:hypothetical protein